MRGSVNQNRQNKHRHHHHHRHPQHSNTTGHSPSSQDRRHLSPQLQIKEAIYKAAKDQNSKEKFNLVSKKRVMENFSIISPHQQKKDFVILTPDRWSSNGWKYTTVRDKSSGQYFNHPFKKNCTGYTNINMTATKDGRLRKDHFKSTYSNSFCQDFEELKRQLSPLPRIIAGKTQYTPSRRENGNHQRGFSDYTPKKLQKIYKRSADNENSHARNSLTHAGALHMHHDRHHKQYRVTMNNDGVPLRNLTLGGMVGGKTADNSKLPLRKARDQLHVHVLDFDVWAGQAIMKGRGVSQLQPFNRKKTFMTKWEQASFNGGVF